MEAILHPPAPQANSDDARRERKRAHDRRAQRVARERNKNRIAQLEATVAALRRQGRDDRSAGLTEQLDALARERDELATVFSNIEAAMRKYTDRSAEKGTAAPNAEQLSSSTTSGQDHEGYHRTVHDGWSEIPVLDSDLLGLTNEPCPHQSDPCEGSVGTAIHGDGLLGPAPFDRMTPASSNFWSGALLDSPSTVLPTHDLIAPPPETPCDCSPPMPTTGVAGGPGNVWRSANAILSEPHHLSEALLQYEDTTSEDIAIRVIVEGWDTVERSTQLPPIWRKLRKIDELQFKNCANTERLAVLSTMHLVLRCHADPTPERWSQLPPWLQKRPCQTAMIHSYAIDFFVWPGLRERFVFSQHRYCSNKFWEDFTANFMMVWPYEFRDCYRRDLETGNFSISTEFKTRMSDLNAWTMCPDFFERFSDLYSDIPRSKSLPKQLYANVRANKLFPTQLSYQQRRARSKRPHPTSAKETHQDHLYRQYDDDDWSEGLSHWGSNAEHSAVDEHLQLGFL